MDHTPATDLFMLQVAYNIWLDKKADDRITDFLVFPAREGHNDKFFMAGTKSIKEWQNKYHFHSKLIDSLRNLPLCQAFSPDFWEYICTKTFSKSCEILLLPDGTEFEQGEEFGRITGPAAIVYIYRQCIHTILSSEISVATNARKLAKETDRPLFDVASARAQNFFWKARQMGGLAAAGFSYYPIQKLIKHYVVTIPIGAIPPNYDKVPALIKPIGQLKSSKGIDFNINLCDL
jgi:nicotinic acid phosphoribosyltransferase